MHENVTIWRTGYMPLIIGGIGAMGSALLMPWVIVITPFAGQIARTGMQLRDGRFFALGLIVLALLAWSEARTPKATTRTALLVGFVVLGFALGVEYRDLTRLVATFNNDGFAQAKLGFGMYAMGLGLTCGLAGVLKRRIDFQPSRAHPGESGADQFVGS